MPLQERPTPFRDARIFILSLEGEGAGEESCYFKAVASSDLIDQRRVRIHLVPTPTATHRSSPPEVLSRASQAIGEYDGSSLASAWIIIDVDSWKKPTLHEVCRKAKAQRVGVAMSNPCFELWLFLHYAELSPSDLTQLDALKEKKRSKDIKRRLGAQRKPASAARSDISGPMLRCAIERARALDCDMNGKSGLPTCPSTGVFRLFDELRAAGVLRAL